MNKPIIIFGTGELSSLVWKSIVDSKLNNVAGFVVDTQWYDKDIHMGLPVVSMDQIERVFPAHLYDALVPIGWSQINGARRACFDKLTKLGYHLSNFVSSYSCVMSESKIKQNCIIFEQVIIQHFVELGKNIIIRAGSNIGHHSVIDDHCFIASGVTTGGNVHIAKQCFIGLGAVIRDGIKVAPRSFIGAGAVVIEDTEADGVYVGNPAKRLTKSSLEVTKIVTT